MVLPLFPRQLSLHDHSDVHNRWNCTRGNTTTCTARTSTTSSEYCNCGTFAVFSTLNHPGICRCTQRACERPCPSTNTVGSRPISHGLHPRKLLNLRNRGHRTPDQWTATGESQGSAELDREKRPLRHDKVVDDLDMHNGGHVNDQSKNAQFDTVRTCLCSKTAISTALSMN